MQTHKVTNFYKKVPESWEKAINRETREIPVELKIDNRMKKNYIKDKHLPLLKNINLISKTTFNIDDSIQLNIMLEKLANAFLKDHANI